VPTPKEVIDDWYHRVVITQRAHYLSADHFGSRKYWLGIPAVVLFYSCWNIRILRLFKRNPSSGCRSLWV